MVAFLGAYRKTIAHMLVTADEFPRSESSSAENLFRCIFVIFPFVHENFFFFRNWIKDFWWATESRSWWFSQVLLSSWTRGSRFFFVVHTCEILIWLSKKLVYLDTNDVSALLLTFSASLRRWWLFHEARGSLSTRRRQNVRFLCTFSYSRRTLSLSTWALLRWTFFTATSTCRRRCCRRRFSLI